MHRTGRMHHILVLLCIFRMRPHADITNMLLYVSDECRSVHKRQFMWILVVGVIIILKKKTAFGIMFLDVNKTFVVPDVQFGMTGRCTMHHAPSRHQRAA